MKKTLSCLVVMSLFAAGSAFASGYRIPEQSVDAVSKAGANIASASSADAAYYNPAGAALLRDGWLTNINFNYIHLTKVKYTDNRSPLYNAESRNENFLLPTIFVLSPKFNPGIGNFRAGFSITAPYGLAKRWDDPFPKTFAEKFSVQVFDINPTLSYEIIPDKLAIAGGWRVLYAKATVMSNGTVDRATGITASRYMDGDTTEWGGWNVGLDWKPTKESNLAATYRSHVDLDYDGHAILNTNYPPGNPTNHVTTSGNVTVPAPAVLAISGSYTFFDKFTVELTWDRTFWSKFDNLDFQYDKTIYNPVLHQAFNTPVNKDWDDSSAYRLGLKYAVNHQWTLMAGIAYDESPAPDETLGFELPDANAVLVSLGARYAITDNMEVGLGLLYDKKDTRSVRNDTINGTFTNEAALLVSAGFQYRF